MGKLKVGDRVLITEDFGGARTEGKVGVIALCTRADMAGVDFGCKLANRFGALVFGHNLGGAIKTNTGWNVPQDLVRLLEEEPFEGNT